MVSSGTWNPTENCFLTTYHSSFMVWWWCVELTTMRLARELEPQWKKVFLVHLPYIIPSGSGGLMVVGSFGAQALELAFWPCSARNLHSLDTAHWHTFSLHLPIGAPSLKDWGKKKLPVQLIKYPIHPSFSHTTIQVLATPQSDFTPNWGTGLQFCKNWGWHQKLGWKNSAAGPNWFSDQNWYSQEFHPLVLDFHYLCLHWWLIFFISSCQNKILQILWTN